MVINYEKKSVVRGHHIYKSIWTPAIGEELLLEVEDGNKHDKHAVASERLRTCATPRHLFRTRRLLDLQPNFPSWHVNETGIYSNAASIQEYTVLAIISQYTSLVCTCTYKSMYVYS